MITAYNRFLIARLSFFRFYTEGSSFIFFGKNKFILGGMPVFLTHLAENNCKFIF